MLVGWNVGAAFGLTAGIQGAEVGVVAVGCDVQAALALSQPLVYGGRDQPLRRRSTGGSVLALRRHEPVRTKLHESWLRQLNWQWRRTNDERLDGQLRPPVLTIDRGEGPRLGHWEPQGRIIGIGERHIWDHPWEEVVSTLHHEMAHQVVDELLGGGGRPHGERFKHACKMLDIEDGASGSPDRTDRSEADRVLSRVRKLLALAGSGNEHEAASAMATANTLLLRYNLELPSTGGRPDFNSRRVGESAANLNLQRKLVAGILSEFFFVECIWVHTFSARKGREERILEILGSAANLDMAEYVHDFLHEAVVRLWRARKAQVADGQRSRKREFAAGVLSGLRDRLRAERLQNEARGLVWVGDADLQGFLHERHPHIGKLAGAGVRRSAAHNAGREEGRALTIHRPVGSGGHSPGSRSLPGPGGSRR